MDTTAQLQASAGEAAGLAIGRKPAGNGVQPMEQHLAWPMLQRLPVVLAVSIPLRGLKVCHVLELGAGQTLKSSWAVKEDVPLKTGVLQLGWGEFEVVEQKMALRLTRLA
jgi:flagellar motor switch protein FliN/FliY